MDMKTITGPELNACLSRLKRTISGITSRMPKNLLFFSAVSFYYYIKDWPCHGRSSVDDLLNHIEPYIPIRLTQEMFDMFLDNILAAKNGGELNTELMVKAKGDFVLAVQNAGGPEEWAAIVNTCESIREMKESQKYATLV
jgi:hypothetical protein